MANETQSVLLNVEIDNAQAIQNIADLQAQIAKLRAEQENEIKEQKKLGNENGKTTTTYVRLDQQIKALNKQIQEQTKIIQDEAKEIRNAEGSYNALSAQLGQLKAAYKAAASDEERAAILEQLTVVDQRLKELDEAQGVYVRNVGNYKGALLDVFGTLEQGTGVLGNLASATGTYGKTGQAMASVLGTIQKNATFVIKAGKMLITTKQAEDAVEQKNIITKTAELLVDKSGVKTLAAKRVATLSQTAATSTNVVVTKAATIATAAWNLVLKANPVMLLVTGVGLLIGAIGGLISLFKRGKTPEEQAADAMKKYGYAAQATADALEQVKNAQQEWIDLSKAATERDLENMRAKGATEDQLYKERMKREKELLEQQSKDTKVRDKYLNQQIELVAKNMNAQEDYLKTLKKESDKWYEQKKKVDELNKQYRQLWHELEMNKIARINAVAEIQKIENDAAERERERTLKRRISNIEEESKQHQEALKIKKQAAELYYAQNNTSNYELFKVQQAWDKKMLAAQHETEQKKLQAQMKAGQITLDEYNKQIRALNARMTEFENQQEMDRKKFLTNAFKNLMKQVGKDLEGQLAEQQNVYDNSVETARKYLGLLKTDVEQFRMLQQKIANGEELDFGMQEYYDSMKDKMEQYLSIEQELYRQNEEAKTNIRKQLLDKRLKIEFDAIEQESAEELTNYATTEARKSEIAIQNAQKRKELLQRELESEQDEKVRIKILQDIAKQEEIIRKNTVSMNQALLDKELLQATGQYSKQYNAKVEYLQKELEAVKGNADAEAAVLQKMAEARSEYLDNMANSLANWGGGALDIIDTVFGAMEEHENAEMEEYEAENEKKKALLQERLDSGLISQESYDSQVAQIDAEAEKKKKELALKQAKRQKAMAVMNALLNAAGAIIASLAQSPVAIGPIPNPVGIASLALATATGTAQVAAAAATPLPKASKGMLIKGPSHKEGGTLIEAEGGEAVINKKATSRYLPILSRINQSTGGVPLYGSGGLVGQQAIDRAQQVADTEGVISQLKMYVAVTDINRGQEDMVRVTERKNY